MNADAKLEKILLHCNEAIIQSENGRNQARAWRATATPGAEFDAANDAYNFHTNRIMYHVEIRKIIEDGSNDAV